MVTLSSFFLFCPATFLYDMDFFGEIRNMSIFGTKYRFKWQAIAFQLDIDIHIRRMSQDGNLVNFNE
jgi:hypothetical protein